jgi:hypothetical protein
LSGPDPGRSTPAAATGRSPVACDEPPAVSDAHRID